MSRHRLFPAIVAAVLASGAVLAQTPTPAAPPASPQLEPASSGMSSMAQLDSNRDGFVDKSEIPAGNELAGKFARLDTNSDGKLDGEEFARYQAEKR